MDCQSSVILAKLARMESLETKTGYYSSNDLVQFYGNDMVYSTGFDFDYLIQTMQL